MEPFYVQKVLQMISQVLEEIGLIVVVQTTMNERNLMLVTVSLILLLMKT